MESPAQRSTRLVAALEDLTAEVASALRSRDFVAASATLDRAAPIVAELAERASDVSDEGLRERLRALQARRKQSSDWLAAEIARSREELGRIAGARRTVAQVAPVYGAAPAAGRATQLRAVS